MLRDHEAAAEGGTVFFDAAVRLGQAVVHQPLALVEEAGDEEIEEATGVGAKACFVGGFEAEVADGAQHVDQRTVPAILAADFGAIRLRKYLDPEVADLDEPDVGAEAHRRPPAREVAVDGRVGERGERAMVARREGARATLGAAELLADPDRRVLEDLDGDARHRPYAPGS